MKNSLVTCLWFDGQAEEAARFYTSLFPDSEMGRVIRFGGEGQAIHGRPEGSVMTVEFTLRGQAFVGLNGGPAFRFNEAVSFQVLCEDQEEIDYYWDKLSAGGDEQARQCGWLKDRYGVSWQVIPGILSDLVSDPDQARADRVMKAMLAMKKLDIAALQAAAHKY